MPRHSFAATTPAPPVLDPDAVVYIAALAAQGYNADATLQTALSDFYKFLKGEVDPLVNVYNDTVCMLPTIGGTTDTHNIDGINPGGSHNGVFTGGWTHSANGSQGNGTSGVLSLGITPSTTFSSTNRTYIYYNRTNSPGSYAILGATNAGFAGDAIYPSLAGNCYYSIACGTGAGYANANTSGLWLLTRRAAADEEIYKNGVSQSNFLSAVSFDPNIDLKFNARNYNGTVDRFAPFEFCFIMAIDRGLSDYEATELSTAINTLQTVLSRNIY